MALIIDSAEARRLARMIVSDIELYNRDAIASGKATCTTIARRADPARPV